MKTFLQIREKRISKMPPGEHVFDTKVKGIEVMVHKEKNKFVTYVDMEKLDTFVGSLLLYCKIWGFMNVKYRVFQILIGINMT